jgi:cell division protease FtsH
MGGATFALPGKDRHNYSKKWCTAFIKVAFGGRIAEEMFTGDTNSGVMGDIRQATSVARKMITEWGMNDRLGFVFYGEDDSRPNWFGGFGEGRSTPEDTQRIIDEEVKKLIDTLYEETRKLIEANKDRVDAIAKALLKHETLDSAEVDAIMRGQPFHKPTVSDLLEKRTRAAGRSSAERRSIGTGCASGGGPLPAPG